MDNQDLRFINFLVYDYCLKNVNMPKIKNVGEHFLEALLAEAQLNVTNLKRINFKDEIDGYRLKKLKNFTNQAKIQKTKTIYFKKNFEVNFEVFFIQYNRTIIQEQQQLR